MDRWGARICSERREEITAWIRKEQSKRGWVEILRAGVLMFQTGLYKVPGMTSSDPAPALVDEAIRRAEAKLKTGHAPNP